MEKPTECRLCGAAITQAATGRPRLFCTDAHRREYAKVRDALRMGVKMFDQMLKPRLGRIVHVIWPDGVMSPAVITRTAETTQSGHAIETLPPDRWGNRPGELLGDAIDLQVFGLVNVYPLYGVLHSPVPLPDMCVWCWPARL